MTEPRTRAVAWDAEFWVDAPLSGAAHYVSDDPSDAPPIILVPDGKGDYREHRVLSRPKARLGF